MSNVQFNNNNHNQNKQYREIYPEKKTVLVSENPTFEMKINFYKLNQSMLMIENMKFVLRRHSIAKPFKCPVQPLEFDMDVMGNLYYNL